MYNEEKIINGVLHFRSIPNGPWLPSGAPYAAAVNALAALGDKDRHLATLFFCADCGCTQDDVPCQCWNDE